MSSFIRRATALRATRRSTTLAAAPRLAACAPVAIGPGGAPGAGPRGAGAGATPAAADDTLRGIVRVTGNEPAVTIILEPSVAPDRIDARAVTLAGERTVLRQLADMEVVVTGTSESDARFVVSDVALRAVSGVTALDGILEQSDGGYAIRTRDGTRLPVAHLPAPLRARVGQRVWIAGALSAPPEAYGVIR